MFYVRLAVAQNCKSFFLFCVYKACILTISQHFCKRDPANLNLRSEIKQATDAFEERV